MRMKMEEPKWFLVGLWITGFQVRSLEETQKYQTRTSHKSTHIFSRVLCICSSSKFRVSKTDKYPNITEPIPLLHRVWHLLSFATAVISYIIKTVNEFAIQNLCVRLMQPQWIIKSNDIHYSHRGGIAYLFQRLRVSKYHGDVLEIGLIIDSIIEKHCSLRWDLCAGPHRQCPRWVRGLCQTRTPHITTVDTYNEKRFLFHSICECLPLNVSSNVRLFLPFILEKNTNWYSLQIGGMRLRKFNPEKITNA